MGDPTDPGDEQWAMAAQLMQLGKSPQAAMRAAGLSVHVPERPPTRPWIPDTRFHLKKLKEFGIPVPKGATPQQMRELVHEAYKARKMDPVSPIMQRMLARRGLKAKSGKEARFQILQWEAAQRLPSLADIEEACKVASGAGWTKEAIAAELRGAGASWSAGRIVACPDARRVGLVVVLRGAPVAAPVRVAA